MIKLVQHGSRSGLFAAVTLCLIAVGCTAPEQVPDPLPLLMIEGSTIKSLPIQASILISKQREYVFIDAGHGMLLLSCTQPGTTEESAIEGFLILGEHSHSMGFKSADIDKSSTVQMKGDVISGRIVVRGSDPSLDEPRYVIVSFDGLQHHASKSIQELDERSKSAIGAFLEMAEECVDITEIAGEIPWRGEI